MRKGQLSALKSVAEVLSELKLAEVARHSNLCAEIEHRIVKIDAHRKKLMHTCEDPFHSAILADQSRRLRRQQVAELTRLAAAQAQLEAAKTDARPAFGRLNVLNEILKQGAHIR